MSSERQTGRVEWFDPAIGYGWIKRPGQKDIFVHNSEIISPDDERRDLKAGDHVEYTLGIDKMGRPCSLKVQLLPQPIGAS